jgi:hypothetical protein
VLVVENFTFESGQGEEFRKPLPVTACQPPASRCQVTGNADGQKWPAAPVLKHRME